MLNSPKPKSSGGRVTHSKPASILGQSTAPMRMPTMPQVPKSGFVGTKATGCKVCPGGNRGR